MNQATGQNIASASWGDHLTFGEADGLLDTQDKLKRRMEMWQNELNAGVVHWRHGRRTRKGRYYTGRNYRREVVRRDRQYDKDWDDSEVMPSMAHEFGMEAYLYVSIFAEGWPLAPKEVRAVSHHNAMHGQHFVWQSDFSRNNPHYVNVDRSGELHQ